MKKSISAKAKKELERRFGKREVNNVKYFDHLDFRLIEDLTDEAFAYLMENVMGVNMLDLNETDITNESIALLTHLEYVKELRAKECHNLDDGCTEDLNKLSSLVFLHLKNTNVTIDGLLKLNNLSNLKTLMFSADDVDAIKEKLLQLKVMLPQCEIIINSKPYQFNAVSLCIYALKKRPYTFRLKIKNEPLINTWSSWLGQPSMSYIEAAAQGTFSIDDVEWIDINPIEKITEGKLTAVKAFDHTEAVTKLLDCLTLVYMITDGIISVYAENKEIY